MYNPYYVDIAFKDKNGKVLKSEDLDKKNKENIIKTTDDKKNTKEIKFDGKQLELEYKTEGSGWKALTNISEDVIKNLTDIRIVAKEKVKQ